MGLVVGMFILALFLFTVGVVLVCFKESYGIVPGFIGLLILVAVTFAGAPNEFPSGKPVYGNILAVGPHKVCTVYVAGDYVTLGIEHSSGKDADPEHLYFYQYKKADFQYLNLAGKKLVVTESPLGFKWMRLE